MRPLIVSHTYLAPENMKQLTAFGEVLGEPVYVVSDKGRRVELYQYQYSTSPLSGQGFYIYCVTSWPFSNSDVRSVLVGIKQIIDEVCPDIVYIEMPPWSIPAIQFVTMRNLGMINAAGVALIRQPYFNLDWQSGWVLKPRIARLACRQFDLLIATTETAKVNVLQHSLGHKEECPPVRTIYSLGVDSALFQPPTPHERQLSRQRWEINDRCLVIGYCGRLVAGKGLVDLLHALHLLKEDTNGTHLVLAVLGKGPLFNEISDLAHKYNIPVLFQSPVPHSDVYRFLHGLDIFVLPSRITQAWIEHDAHVVVEAMACGLPVVGSDSGPIPEILGNAGLVFPAGDIENLLSCLKQLLKNPELRIRMGSQGRERVLDHYSHKKVAELTITALREALEK